MAGETGAGTSTDSGGAGGTSSSTGTTTPDPKSAQSGATGAGAATTVAGGTGEGGQDPKGAGTEAAAKGGEPKGQESAPAELALTLPKGVEADSEMLTAFKTMAKETGISAENAQKIVDIYASAYQTTERKHIEAFAAQQAEWVKSIQQDKELGGGNLKTTQEQTSRAMRAFSTPEFVKFLDESGLTNHPEMVRHLARVGKTLKEDSISGTSSSQGGSGKLTDEEVAKRRYDKTWPTP